jgi:hypothetical protein
VGLNTTTKDALNDLNVDANDHENEHGKSPFADMDLFVVDKPPSMPVSALDI